MQIAALILFALVVSVAIYDSWSETRHRKTFCWPSTELCWFVLLSGAVLAVVS